MFRKLSRRLFMPLSMAIMVLGIVSLCQPWSAAIHRHGFIVTLIGFVGFLFFSHVHAPENEREADTE